jgi:CspA family cold shock protein
MTKGTVKFFNEAKGFGFISPADGSKDVFVHASGITGGTIRDNDQVEFDVEKDAKGFKATNVRAL